MTFNTTKGLCSLSVNLNDLKKSSSDLTPVKRTSSAMPGVTHYEAEPKKTVKTNTTGNNDQEIGDQSSSSSSSSKNLRIRKTIGSGASKIPMPNEMAKKSRIRSPGTIMMKETKKSSEDRTLSNPSLSESSSSFKGDDDVNDDVNAGTVTTEGDEKIRRTQSTDSIQK